MAVLGIDLGTTNSLAAYWEDGKVHLVTDEHGEALFPSVVGYIEGEGLVAGAEAKERILTHREDTVCSFKRFMGTAKKYRLGGSLYTPMELSAMVLERIRRNAEYFLKEEIEEAIITVPAYFNDKQRSDTKKAAKIAGLKVERLINEPSCKSLHFAASAQEIRAAYSETDRQIPALSVFSGSSPFPSGRSFNIDICMPLFAKIKKLFLHLLKDAGAHVSNLTDLVMVGGSSRLGVVKRFLTELLGKEPVVLGETDKVVAMGAGVYAGIRTRKEDIRDMLLTDVCPFTLGVEVWRRRGDGQNVLLPMIERNSTLPMSTHEHLVTVHDYQSEIRVGIYQGEEYYAKDNLFLGEVLIPVSPKPAGQEGVDVHEASWFLAVSTAFVTA